MTFTVSSERWEEIRAKLFPRIITCDPEDSKNAESVFAQMEGGIAPKLGLVVLRGILDGPSYNVNGIVPDVVIGQLPILSKASAEHFNEQLEAARTADGLVPCKTLEEYRKRISDSDFEI